MLQQLDIQNVALIEKVSIEPGTGLNILTGETGAGKSIIIDALQAVLGERLSRETIRTGAERALVEAVFRVEAKRLDDDLAGIGIEPEEDGTLIISREFNISGKNTCRINGKLVTLSALKQLGEKIVDVHGQHDNQSLLRTSSHIELLDAFGGEAVQRHKSEYRTALEEYKSTRQKLKAYTGDEGERVRHADLLRYQADEIGKTALKPGDEEELGQKRLVLSNAEKIIASLASAYENVFAGGRSGRAAIDAINEAISDVSPIVRLDPRYEGLSEKLREVSYQLEDIAAELRSERDGIECDPGMLERIDERLDLIFRLKKKYGSSIEKVLEYRQKALEELERIEGAEEAIKELENQASKLEERLADLAGILHTDRLAAAHKLEDNIGEVLNDLEMRKAQFKVSLQYDGETGADERKFTSNGLDNVEFLFSSNAGEPLKPLSRIASGGEMSRIMLAIKTILADVDMIPTLIFDEIDIGISGKAAQKVGEKLSFISGKHQVLCVTHLAQIASMADVHFLISKETAGERTETRVEKLSGAGSTDELARILGTAGSSDTSHRLAAEMLEYARRFKEKR